MCLHSFEVVFLKLMSQCTVKLAARFFFPFSDTKRSLESIRLFFISLDNQRMVRGSWEVHRSPTSTRLSFRGTIPSAHSAFSHAWAVPDSDHSHCHCRRFMLLCFLCLLQFSKRKRHSSALTSDKILWGLLPRSVWQWEPQEKCHGSLCPHGPW